MVGRAGIASGHREGVEVPLEMGSAEHSRVPGAMHSGVSIRES